MDKVTREFEIINRQFANLPADLRLMVEREHEEGLLQVLKPFLPKGAKRSSKAALRRAEKERRLAILAEAYAADPEGLNGSPIDKLGEFPKF